MNAENPVFLWAGYALAFGLVGTLIYTIKESAKQEDLQLRVQKARLALTGAPRTPNPLTTKQSIADSMANFEECLAKKCDKDPVWITLDYDLANGHFQTHAYSYRAHGRNVPASENYVYLDASFIFNEETAETKITWSFSVKATKNYPKSDSNISQVYDVMAQATSRIRWKFGAPILVGLTRKDPSDGGEFPIQSSDDEVVI